MSSLKRDGRWGGGGERYGGISKVDRAMTTCATNKWVIDRSFIDITSIFSCGLGLCGRGSV